MKENEFKGLVSSLNNMDRSLSKTTSVKIMGCEYTMLCNGYVFGGNRIKPVKKYSIVSRSSVGPSRYDLCQIYGSEMAAADVIERQLEIQGDDIPEPTRKASQSMLNDLRSGVTIHITPVKKIMQVMVNKKIVMKEVITDFKNEIVPDCGAASYYLDGFIGSEVSDEQIEKLKEKCHVNIIDLTK